MKKELNLTFEITRKMLLNANALNGMHYQTKGNKARLLRSLGSEVGNEHKGTHFSKFEIEVEVFSPTRRRLDPPNLYPTVKHLIDGLTDSGLWDDDDYTKLTKMSFVYGGLIKEVFVDNSFDKSSFVIKFKIKEV